jgi:hypothetical protein
LTNIRSESDILIGAKKESRRVLLFNDLLLIVRLAGRMEKIKVLVLVFFLKKNNNNNT